MAAVISSIAERFHVFKKPSIEDQKGGQTFLPEAQSMLSYPDKDKTIENSEDSSESGYSTRSIDDRTPVGTSYDVTPSTAGGTNTARLYPNIDELELISVSPEENSVEISKESVVPLQSAPFIRRSDSCSGVESKRTYYEKEEDSSVQVLTEKHQKDDIKAPRDHRQWTINVIFGLLDVLLLITIFVVAFGIPSRGADYCLPCTDVYLTIDDNLDNIYNFEKKEDLCCSQNYTSLIKKFVVKRYRQDKAKESTKAYPVFKKSAVHLSLAKEKTNLDAGLGRKLCWGVNELKHVTDDLSVSDNGDTVTVHRSGLYFVSAQMSFLDGRSSAGSDITEEMKLSVQRHRDDKTDTLLENRRTVSPHKPTGPMPVDVGAVFDLLKGDKLSVTISNATTLFDLDGSNYFEVYLI